MGIYLCYGCDTMKDDDYVICYESIEAKKKETGALQFQLCCEDCHDDELMKNAEKCMACEDMTVIDNECIECGAKSIPLQPLK